MMQTFFMIMHNHNICLITKNHSWLRCQGLLFLVSNKEIGEFTFNGQDGCSAVEYLLLLSLLDFETTEFSIHAGISLVTKFQISWVLTAEKSNVIHCDTFYFLYLQLNFDVSRRPITQINNMNVFLLLFADDAVLFLRLKMTYS